MTGTMFMGRDTQTAIANGDTRTISFYHTHRKDSITVTFKRGGYYDKAALSKLNYFLRDWRNDAQTNMDPRLFDVVWEAYSEAGVRSPIQIVSAYRSPATNAMLRRRSRGVAKHSQHTLGKAMDTTVPGVNMARIREVGMRLQMGGVGFYPRSNTPFVHLDVGNVRAWPRMSRSQLAKIFPDGRTVHLPREGGTMPGYQLALADIQRYGRGVGGAEGEDGDGGRTFLGALFGGGTDEAENYTEQDDSTLALAMRDARRRNGQVQVAAAEPEPAPVPAKKARPAVPAQKVKIAEPEPMVAPATLTPTPIPRARQTEPEVQIALGAPESLQPQLQPETSSVRVPLPPRRPANIDSLVQVASVDAFADVPLPPERPSTLGSGLALMEAETAGSAGATPGTDSSGVVPELGPVAVLRPTTTSSTPRPLPEPESAQPAKGKALVEPPPLRVAGLTAESETSLVRSLVAQKKTPDAALPELILEGRAKADAVEEPGPSLALVDVPLPPRRPVTLRAAAKANGHLDSHKPVLLASTETRPDESQPVIKLRPSTKSLMLPKAETPAAAAPKAASKPKVKAAPVIAGKFSKDNNGLAAGTFTGSIVRPLGAKFVKREITLN